MKLLVPDLSPTIGRSTQQSRTAGRSKGERSVSHDWSKERKILLRLHEEVLQKIHELTAEAREENSTYSLHMADAATDSIDRDIFLGLVSFEQESLYEIDAALKRIEEGTYGVCELTGKPISRQRLRAIPWARFAPDAQQRIAENSHPHIGALGRIRFERQEQPEAA